MAFTTLRAHGAARKCWANRLRGRCARVPVRVFVDLQPLAAPVALLDVLDLVFRQAEVVPDLVNQRFRNRDDHIVAIARGVFDRALKERDLVRQRVAVRPLSLGERRAFVQAQQRVGRLDPDVLQGARGRLVLDDDGDVLHRVAKPIGDGRQRFVHQRAELLAIHHARFFRATVPRFLK
jgi:hypothetical protein